MDQSTLKALLDYSPEDGSFRWHASTGGKKANEIAGNTEVTGYVRIGIAGKTYMAHRLAWLYVHGMWPPAQLDHINRIRNDNRIVNLRLSTQIENMRNARWRNSHGLRGVHYYKPGKYQARISFFDKRKGKSVQRSLGYYSTAQEANEVYELVAQMTHGEFYCG